MNLSLAFFHIITSSLLLLVTGVSLRGQDERPVVDDRTIPRENAADAKLPAIHLVGDSTVRSSGSMRGWGQDLASFFDKSKINVVNHAIGGRSSRTFQTEGRWERVVAALKQGDFVLVQFGHNDGGRYDDPRAKGRPSLKGEGEDTAEVKKSDGSTETIHSFGWYMRKYGNDAKAKGAKVIFCSMVPHKDWKDGKIVRGVRDSFVKWTENAAKATGAAFVDLNEIVALEYEKLGPEQVEPLFADKRTHTSPAGAELNARCVVSGLRALPGAPLDRFLSEKGTSVKAAAAKHVAGAAR